MKKFVILFSLLLSVSAAAFADELPPPKNTDPVAGTLTIVLDKEAKEPKLLISQITLEELYNGSESAGLASVSRTQALFGGLLLSISFVIGGVWLARRRVRSAGVAAGLIFTFATGTVLISANVGPPAAYRSINSGLFSEGMQNQKYAGGPIKVQVSTEIADGARLIIPLAKEGSDSKKKTDE
ncbi:MAG: hypothetical protein DWQ47_09060 [Acidobacteria bacterium]|nr:MAG: hypothetical protein DWQ32_17160 [Acidobacteriota bacterium]REJ98947.1 MAG: hypothetical protein DWQ38_12820 [Acidobacteriota bacterium]REK16333.1 MAG: hypothetical protein DWQ43_04870 [Acidobacteriota bacterium]REK44014.1 MAG: hypothetical protein DWQ47_09060 [Acidobacteriota bacterium]